MSCEVVRAKGAECVIVEIMKLEVSGVSGIGIGGTRTRARARIQDCGAAK